MNIAMVLGNAEAIAVAVEEELGIAFVARLAAGRGMALGRIVEVSVEGMELGRNIYLAHHRRQRLTRAQAKFWEYVNSSKSEFSAVVG
ncbi:MAG: LysR substrate-binding domain-containing protein [Anaerolineales bacterium]